MGLSITNSFQLRDMYKSSLMHPRSEHWQHIDYVIVKRRDFHEVQIARTIRGAECFTYHRLIRSTLRLTVRPPARRQRPMRNLNARMDHGQNIWKNCATPVLNLYPAYHQQLHHGAPQTLLWNGRLFPQPDQMPPNELFVTCRDDIKTGSKTAPMTSVLLSTMKTLETMLCCGIRFLTLFMKDFPPFERLCSASCVLSRTIGGCGKLVGYRVTLMSIMQRAFYEVLKADSVLLHHVRSIDCALNENRHMILGR